MPHASVRPLDHLIAELAERQHGVVARRQLLALGATPEHIRTRSRRGSLRPIHTGIYAVGHRPQGRQTRWMAGVLAAGPGALLSHQSAAVLWTLLRHDATTHVTSVRRSGSRPGLTVHRTTSLSGADRTRRDDIPVTALPRTLIDLADVLTPTQLAQAVERVPKIDVPTMRRALTRHPGRNGTAAFTKLLDAYDAPTRSPLETAFLKLCRHHQLPTPLVNTTIAGDERDFAWPDQRLVIETDGHAFHHTRAQRAHDNRRDTDLGTHGWRPHRLTYEQVLLDPTGTATNVKALLDAPSYGAVATTISDITSRRSEFAS